MTARRDPRINGSTREGKMLAAVRNELDRRIGRSPSFEARETADQIMRAKLEIALLERKRTERGGLGVRDSEFLIRLENTLARLLERLERLAPPPPAPSLTERIEARRMANQAAPA